MIQHNSNFIVMPSLQRSLAHIEAGQPLTAMIDLYIYSKLG